MHDAYLIYQRWLMEACLWALSILVPLYCFLKFLPPIWRLLRDAWNDSVGNRSLVVKLYAIVFLMVNFYLGATKPPMPHVGYDGGIRAGDTANSITNDTVSITWQRDLSGGVYVPESATVYIYYREIADTNGVWTLLAETTVGAWGWSGTVQNATNYDYSVWAYYIPPEPVHTNGVWTYRTLRDRNGEYPIPIRARIEVNGKAIATPKEVRRDEEQND